MEKNVHFTGNANDALSVRTLLNSNLNFLQIYNYSNTTKYIFTLMFFYRENLKLLQIFDFH